MNESMAVNYASANDRLGQSKSRRDSIIEIGFFAVFVAGTIFFMPEYVRHNTDPSAADSYMKMLFITTTMT